MGDQRTGKLFCIYYRTAFAFELRRLGIDHGHGHRALALGHVPAVDVRRNHVTPPQPFAGGSDRKAQGAGNITTGEPTIPATAGPAQRLSFTRPTRQPRPTAAIPAPNRRFRPGAGTKFPVQSLAEKRPSRPRSSGAAWEGPACRVSANKTVRGIAQRPARSAFRLPLDLLGKPAATACRGRHGQREEAPTIS